MGSRSSKAPKPAKGSKNNCNSNLFNGQVYQIVGVLAPPVNNYPQPPPLPYPPQQQCISYPPPPPPPRCY